MSKITAHIRDARRVPEPRGQYCITGLIYGDIYQRWPDGHPVWTSRIVSERGDRFITSIGTVYKIDNWKDGEKS